MGSVGCKTAAAVHFSPAFGPIDWLWGQKRAKTVLAGAAFRFRRPKPDKLLACAEDLLRLGAFLDAFLHHLGALDLPAGGQALVAQHAHHFDFRALAAA